MQRVVLPPDKEAAFDQLHQAVEIEKSWHAPGCEIAVVVNPDEDIELGGVVGIVSHVMGPPKGPESGVAWVLPESDWAFSLTRHIEPYPTMDPDDELVARGLTPYVKGGALYQGHTIHGMTTRSLSWRTGVTPRVRQMADELREQLLVEYPGIDKLSLPTVELFCVAWARSIGWSSAIAEYTDGGKTRRVKGKVLSGYDAVPQYMFAEEARAQGNAAKFAHDLGLDLTGRANALKDDAITKSLNGRPGLETIGAAGRKLQQLRSRQS